MKNSRLPAVLISAAMLLIGGALELLFFHLHLSHIFFFLGSWHYTLVCLLINLLYAAALGIPYLLRQRGSTGEWRMNLVRNGLLVYPVFLLSLYFLFFNFHSKDSNGPNDLRFDLIYWQERLSAHLCFFLLGLLLFYAFEKKGKESAIAPRAWRRCGLCALILIAALIGFDVLNQVVLRAALWNSHFPLDHYFLFAWFFNVLAGTLLAAAYGGTGFRQLRWSPNFRRIPLCLGVLLIGLIPFLIPYIRNPIIDFFITQRSMRGDAIGNANSVMDFLSYSDFIETVQLLFGFLLFRTLFIRRAKATPDAQTQCNAG